MEGNAPLDDNMTLLKTAVANNGVPQLKKIIRSTIPFAEMRDVQASLAEDEELRRQPFAAAVGIHVAVSLRSQRAWAMGDRLC